MMDGLSWTGVNLIPEVEALIASDKQPHTTEKARGL